MVKKFLEISAQHLGVDKMEMTLPTRRKVSRPGNASMNPNDVRAVPEITQPGQCACKRAC
jgi:hypothetical protein